MPNITIPDFLSHLKVNEKGYPIPYFVARPNGQPDFRLLDERKQLLCIEHHYCAICGKKCFKGAYYFISGPQGFENKISTDPAMHKECAEYSLQTCPHMYFEKADRRDKGIEELPYLPGQVKEKPKVFLLVKADKFDKIPAGTTKHWLIRYRPVSVEIYQYENGILTKGGKDD